jgi:molybdopterin/thiamine biosynthesis adenylyltransferase
MLCSVAMTADTDVAFRAHLIRPDGQEDICFGLWLPSNGARRLTAILQEPILPEAHDRILHGNASFQPGYLLRAAREAARRGFGLVFAHSHPEAAGYQRLNATDREAEARIANVAREFTGLPLVGLVASGRGGWTGRVWAGRGRDVHPRDASSVRVVGSALAISYDEDLHPRPIVNPTQVRTVSTWGEGIQSDIARLRIAVVGAGSVGMRVADVLARTGIEHLGIFDYDGVEVLNLDRLPEASPGDIKLRRAKVEVAARLLRRASTAANCTHVFLDLSVCEANGLLNVLDYDLIFCCADKPWPRHVLNTIAFSDLIPVIEGGLKAFRNTDGRFRNAYWQTTVVRPGRPCLACLRQYDPGAVSAERDGSLEDPTYIAALPTDSPLRAHQNVAALSVQVAGAFLRQFVSFVARPSGVGDPGPIRFNSRTPDVERIVRDCIPGCFYSGDVGVGDRRKDPTGDHTAAVQARRQRADVGWRVKALRALADMIDHVRELLGIWY